MVGSVEEVLPEGFRMSFAEGLSLSPLPGGGAPSPSVDARRREPGSNTQIVNCGSSDEPSSLSGGCMGLCVKNELFGANCAEFRLM